MKISIVTLAAMLALSAMPAIAQNNDITRLDRVLVPNDTIIVRNADGTILKGKFVSVSDQTLVIKKDSLDLNLPAAKIVEVKRRRNGILLGTLIGAGVGVPFGWALGTLFYNEGGDASVAAVPIAIGAAAGMGIDALLCVPRSVYKASNTPRVSIAPFIQPKAFGGAVQIRF